METIIENLPNRLNIGLILLIHHIELLKIHTLRFENAFQDFIAQLTLEIDFIDQELILF
jgi:hypothetical protein